MEKACSLLLCLLFFLEARQSTAYTYANESALRQLLFTTNAYDASVRPTAKVDVFIDFNIHSLNDINTIAMTMSLSGWYDISWSDSRLSWTAADYDNIDHIFVDDDMIWFPKLVVDNSVDDHDPIDSDNLLIRVDSTGTVIWNPPGILTTSCDIDITKFPFDTQTCSLELSTISYSYTEVDLKIRSTGLLTSTMETNGLWDLLSTANELGTYTISGFTYPQLQLQMTYKRKATYFVMNLFLPVIINALIIPLAFLLPADSGEKVGYVLTCLLAYVVLLTMVSAEMPRTSTSHSYLATYNTIILIIATLTVVITIFVLFLHHTSPRKAITPCVRKLYRICSAICCKNCCNKNETSPLSKEEVQSKAEGLYTHRNGGTSAMAFSRPMSPIVQEDEVTWPDVAAAVDGALLRLFYGFIGLITIIFLILMVV